MIFKKYKAERIDSNEKGDVLVIDYEGNFAIIGFFTTDGKYYYEKQYNLDSNEIVFEEE